MALVVSKLHPELHDLQTNVYFAPGANPMTGKPAGVAMVSEEIAAHYRNRPDYDVFDDEPIVVAAPSPQPVTAMAVLPTQATIPMPPPLAPVDEAHL